MPNTLLTRKTAVPRDPPQKPLRPWTRTTVIGFRVANAFTTTFNLGDLLTSLRVQYGLSSDTSAFIAKIHCVKVWASPDMLTGGASGPVAMAVAFYDPNETEGYAIHQMSDVGTTAQPAKVGLLYGDIRAQNQVSLGDVSRKVAVVQLTGVDLAKVNVELTIHVDVEWAYATAI